MKEDKEDFKFDEISERELSVHHVSYKDETYTFCIYGCLLTVNGKKDMASVNIVLHPKEVSEIRDYFFLHGKHWQPSITDEFKQHSPRLYKKIHDAVQSIWEQSDEYASEQEDLLNYGEYADFERIELTVQWPERLFEEMDIHVPNANIWVVNTRVKEKNGAEFPIYLEPVYHTELKEILEKTIWRKSFSSGKIDINNLADKYKDLRDIIKVRIKDMIFSTYDYKECFEDLSLLQVQLRSAIRYQV